MRRRPWIVFGVLLALSLALTAAMAEHRSPGGDTKSSPEIVTGAALAGAEAATLGARAEAAAERWRHQSIKVRPLLLLGLAAVALAIVALRRSRHAGDWRPRSSSPLRRQMLALRGPPLLQRA